MISRRSFLQHSACLGTAAGFSVSPVSQAVAAAAADMETVTWSACSINCGSRCILRCVSKKAASFASKPTTRAIPMPA